MKIISDASIEFWKIVDLYFLALPNLTEFTFQILNIFKAKYDELLSSIRETEEENA